MAGIGTVGRGKAAAVGALAVSLGLCGAVLAEPCATAPIETVWVERVLRGDEMLLTDGRTVILASVEAPRPALDPGIDDAAALAAARGARTALADRVEGRELQFLDLGADRHGRRRGHLLDATDGGWIEAELVGAGHLRVVPGRDDRACAAALLELEAAAIADARGAWASAFAVKPADGSDLAAIVGSYAVVEGRVVSVGHAGTRIFVNFGPDIRRDFAAVLNDKDLAGYARRGVERDRLRGRRVRVRGIVEGRGAPRIVVETPEAIELVTR